MPPPAPGPPSSGGVVGIPGGPPPPGPWSAGLSVAPKKKTRKGVIAVVVILLILVALAALVAVGFWYNATLADAAAANVPADAPVGACYGADGSKREMSCDGPHVFEVYSESFYFGDVDYPSGFARSLGNEICEEDLEFATGENFLLSDWDYALVLPLEADWEAGERRVPCIGFFGDARQITRRLGP